MTDTPHVPPVGKVPVLIIGMVLGVLIGGLVGFVYGLRKADKGEI